MQTTTVGTVPKHDNFKRPTLLGRQEHRHPERGCKHQRARGTRQLPPGHLGGDRCSLPKHTGWPSAAGHLAVSSARTKGQSLRWEGRRPLGTPRSQRQVCSEQGAAFCTRSPTFPCETKNAPLAAGLLRQGIWGPPWGAPGYSSRIS